MVSLSSGSFVLICPLASISNSAPSLVSSEYASVSFSGSVAVIGFPIASPAAVFSSTLRVVGIPALNSGGSFTSVTLMVTSMLSSHVISELPSISLLSLTCTATW